MLEQELVQQGTDLMLFGMGTVFVFLSLLVLSTTLMSGLINRFFPEPEKEIAFPVQSRARKSDDLKPEVLTAIQLAIAKHRNK